ncbi:FGGY family carbohydrate kinase [Paracoccus xiamenensis]|uniref:FGGY family carbohydrate kinase n=1 Tax=Paracoccus xiamenensis TaxID=2714901 RepID=UPI00140E3746|nr:FGGY family carbohydrate kinase [Paracoccus xiamenensis]NHF73227.1 hypothetical protein [Paracoccus xiamenensis]
MLVCGIDIGSTNLKVGLADGAGRLLQTATMPTPRTRDAIGIVTDPAQLLDEVERLVLDVWRKAGIGMPISAFCTTGIGEDGLLLGDDLTPLSAAIPWFDRRASADAAQVAASDAATSRAGIVMDPTRTGAKWRWLARHHPETMARARYWAALTDFPLIAWGATPFISETLAARTGCYDPFVLGWLADLLRACAAPPLPSVVAAGHVCGRLNNPRLIAAGAATADTLLVSGGHDHAIAASAILRSDPSACVDSLGTASVLYAEIPTIPPPPLDPLIALAAPVRGGAGLACIGVLEFSEALNAAGSPNEVRNFLAASPLPGQPGQPHPIIAGHPDARSIRAVVEAAAMTTRAMLGKVPSAGPIYATGGWSRSSGLLQLRASVLGRTILTADEPELALVGAALLAAEATGSPLAYQPDLRAIEPLPAWQRAYDAAYPVFLDRLHAAHDNAVATIPRSPRGTA